MGGKKQFDEQEVMDKALKLFWTKGVEATSLSDLEDATGLKRGSIYNSYGDKDGLFLEVLDKNTEKYIMPMAESLNSPDIKEATSGLIDALIARFRNKDLPSGCLLTGTSMVYNILSDPVKRKVSNQVAGIENTLYNTFLEAQKSGQLSDEQDPRAMARYIMALVMGMSVMDNVIPDATATEDVADVAKKSLDSFFQPKE